MEDKIKNLKNSWEALATKDLRGRPLEELTLSSE